MKLQMKQRERLLSVATLAVILGALVYTLLVEPQLKQRRRLQRSLADTQLRLTKIERDLHRRHSVDKQYRQIAALLPETIDETREVSLFLRQVRDLYSQTQLKPRLVKQQPITREKGHALLSIRLDITAPVEQILKFLESIAKQSEAIAVRRCELKARDVKNTVSASLLVTKVVAAREQS